MVVYPIVFWYNSVGDNYERKHVDRKSIDFGTRIVKLHRYLLKTKHESVLSKQILRSGTLIGANINETQYGNSKADLIAKMHIALKETAETEYWLHLYWKIVWKLSGNQKILIASINTAKERQN